MSFIWRYLVLLPILLLLSLWDKTVAIECVTTPLLEQARLDWWCRKHNKVSILAGMLLRALSGYSWDMFWSKINEEQRMQTFENGKSPRSWAVQPINTTTILQSAVMIPDKYTCDNFFYFRFFSIRWYSFDFCKMWHKGIQTAGTVYVGREHEQLPPVNKYLHYLVTNIPTAR